jgi:hypothetical protein
MKINKAVIYVGPRGGERFFSVEGIDDGGCEVSVGIDNSRWNCEDWKKTKQECKRQKIEIIYKPSIL